ncbi:hypothetical protein I203_104712 [Kwoniella mangroviensis CBS 8507]|uniref:uncharacterized protein n=1 Tax=Kwoniella mangroviensis CBS 8507 TaxID=1296122 RepID=UPI00080D4412|nr:uncharacterized protein I203_00343 [Kwoniella mangroviensis CBS 8507]OCF70211.1 hypothetical protein I203_00343 [Kwoniella mangroviensis CBS 8507]
MSLQNSTFSQLPGRPDLSSAENDANTNDTQSITVYSKSRSNSFLSGLFKKSYEYRSLTLTRNSTDGALWLERGNEDPTQDPNPSDTQEIVFLPSQESYKTLSQFTSESSRTGYLLLSPTGIGVVDGVTGWGSAINPLHLIPHSPSNSCSQDNGKQYHEKRLRLADLTDDWLADWREWRRSYRSNPSTSIRPKELSREILSRYSDCAVVSANKETIEVIRPFLSKGLTREKRGLDDGLNVKGFVR